MVTNISTTTFIVHDFIEEAVLLQHNEGVIIIYNKEAVIIIMFAIIMTRVALSLYFIHINQGRQNLYRRQLSNILIAAELSDNLPTRTFFSSAVSPKVEI